MMVAITWGNINIEPCNHFHRIRYSHRAMAFPNNISRHWFKTVLCPKLEDCFVSYWCIFGRKERFPIGRLLCLPILIHLSFLPSDSRQAAQWQVCVLDRSRDAFPEVVVGPWRLGYDDVMPFFSCVVGVTASGKKSGYPWVGDWFPIHSQNKWFRVCWTSFELKLQPRVNLIHNRQRPSTSFQGLQVLNTKIP